MDENNIFIRITGEADLGEAEAQVRELTNRNKELTAQLKELQTQEKADAKTIEQTVKNKETLGQRLRQNAEYYQRERGFIEQDISANKKNIATLQQSVNQYNALSGAGVRLRTQLLSIREEMVRMAEEGDTTSSRFIELADQAGALSDTIGDAQATISLLASDTKNLDAAMQVGGGLVGTFNAATSAMALLGGESEELQNAFLKVQAAMSVLQGVQQVMTVLDKRSAANVVIRTAAIKLLNKVQQQQATTEIATTTTTVADTTATTASTTATTANIIAIKAKNAAMKLLNKTLLANPVMWLVAGLAALTAGISVLINRNRKAAEAQRDFNGELERTTRLNRQLADDGDFSARIAEAEGKSWREVMDIRRQAAKEQLTNADTMVDRMLKKQRETNGKLSDEEKQALEQAQELQQSAYEELYRLNQEYTIRETEERTAASAQREEDLKAELSKRKQMLIEQAEQERLIRNVLYKSVDKDKAATEVAAHEPVPREEEEVEIGDFDTLVEYMRLKKQLAGENEQEIADWEFHIRQDYLQRKIGIEKAAGRDTTTIENELMQLRIDQSTRLAEIEIENIQRVREEQQAKLQEALDIAGMTLQTLGDITTEIFSGISDNISAQLEQLDMLYTTDAEEARKDANKKYISEKELEDKKAKLKLKQAKLDKANSIFQIGLSTAQAIMAIWAMAGVPVTLKAIQTVAVSAVGAAQLAVAASKPLPQYAKGRKGGEGEYALVGEKGAEIMYIPQGASIIPNSKIGRPDLWGNYGVPTLPIPATANISTDTLNQAVAAAQQWQPIDYDRLGRAVAHAMPKQHTVSVHVDRHGVSVQNGQDNHTYLNTKYNGQW